MRIAQIAPLVERVPPKTYGGTERVIHALTEELVGRGHDVTLFATGDSQTSAKLVSVYPKALRETGMEDVYDRNSWALLNIGMAYEHQDEFDIIHDHNGVLSLPTANMARTPVIMTLHGVFNEDRAEIFASLSSPYTVTISKAQAATVPGPIGNVYNGLSMNSYPFSQNHDGYLLFVGRICEEKGARFAIEVARKLKLPLLMAAKLDPKEKPYFDRFVKPYLSDTIRWIGEVDEEERNHLMSRARCFLHPVTWPEPFGLTLIESLACGVPVVAFNHGSIPEIIEDGETGFVVENVDEMTRAVEKIETINRSYCRSYARENFNAERMTDGYEAIYQAVLNKTSAPVVRFA